MIQNYIFMKKNIQLTSILSILFFLIIPLRLEAFSPTIYNTLGPATGNKYGTNDFSGKIISAVKCESNSDLYTNYAVTIVDVRDGAEGILMYKTGQTKLIGSVRPIVQGMQVLGKANVISQTCIPVGPDKNKSTINTDGTMTEVGTPSPGSPSSSALPTTSNPSDTKTGGEASTQTSTKTETSSVETSKTTFANDVTVSSGTTPSQVAPEDVTASGDLSTSGSATSQATEAIKPPTETSKPGDTGQKVTDLQKWLVSQGYMTEQQMNTGPGIYGQQTANAVKSYQADHPEILKYAGISAPTENAGRYTIAFANGQITGGEVMAQTPSSSYGYPSSYGTGDYFPNSLPTTSLAGTSPSPAYISPNSLIGVGDVTLNLGDTNNVSPATSLPGNETSGYWSYDSKTTSYVYSNPALNPGSAPAIPSGQSTAGTGYNSGLSADTSGSASATAVSGNTYPNGFDEKDLYSSETRNTPENVTVNAGGTAVTGTSISPINTLNNEKLTSFTPTESGADADTKIYRASGYAELVPADAKENGGLPLYPVAVSYGSNIKPGTPLIITQNGQSIYGYSVDVGSGVKNGQVDIFEAPSNFATVSNAGTGGTVKVLPGELPLKSWTVNNDGHYYYPHLNPDPNQPRVYLRNSDGSFYTTAQVNDLKRKAFGL